MFLLILLHFSYSDMLHAQETDAEQSNNCCFEIWIYGDGLSSENMEVSVKTNPEFGEQWHSILSPDRTDPSIRIFGYNRLLILSGLSLEKYFGQDIRENYAAVRVSAEQNTSEIQAFYVLPEGIADKLNLPEQAIDLIRYHPEKIRQRSLACLIRPRPFRLINGNVYTEHIEAPVRHLPPGVQEVKWLKILFRGQ
ncbi:MAG: hypothetical protein R6V04_13915 [bacterium]